MKLIATLAFATLLFSCETSITPSENKLDNVSSNKTSSITNASSETISYSSITQYSSVKASSSATVNYSSVSTTPHGQAFNQDCTCMYTLYGSSSTKYNCPTNVYYLNIHVQFQTSPYQEKTTFIYAYNSSAIAVASDTLFDSKHLYNYDASTQFASYSKGVMNYITSPSLVSLQWTNTSPNQINMYSCNVTDNITYRKIPKTIDSTTKIVNPSELYTPQ